jgi:acetolactate synthase I/II/III large subunit
MTRSGAQIMCEALVREDVRVIFGIPGGAIMPFYHALWEYRDELHHVLCRHEQGAGHAAEGYARASGRVGVCIGTSGPGATNLVTPIADAWMDGTPLVAITGQVSSALLGTDAFQEVDITGITVPITKHNYLVTRADDLPRVFAEAFHIARTGRPGPVHIDVTKDAQTALVEPHWSTAARTTPNAKLTASSPALRAAVALLAVAERPLILAGNGVIQADATSELRQFAEVTGIPVITTLHGLGAFPLDHQLALGMPGMHGWVHVNRALQSCDVLLNIGSRFDDRVTGKAATFAPNAKIIHVDVDAAQIGKVVRADVAVLADARDALRALIAEVPPLDTRAWLESIRQLETTHKPRQAYSRRDREASLMPHDVYDGLNASFASRTDWRVVTDVGQHQMWAAQLLDWRRPRTHITSGGAGTMGFAVPAALGVALACPDDTVWVVVGDGGFQMTNQELATIAQERVRNVKIAVINNGYLGMVRQWQELFENRRYSGTPLSGPDFARLGEAYGLRSFTVADAREVPRVIETAWNAEGSTLIDFRVEQEANVFPMVPAGKSIGEMLVGDENGAHGAPHSPHPPIGPPPTPVTATATSAFRQPRLTLLRP